ncbi:hypothetical protein [Citricoccus sp.]|uniref:hypothetical protein n=1 Tax=Citricoccus sp. TaxID=1978372 RepID=UPI00261CAF76|nr:hypothetical protein [Citricoccus sp.]HRO29634.1 hypothetical protein [Citricoccus sp.]HRO94009.1 hypothetical protein [Citricoccus sp.]
MHTSFPPAERPSPATVPFRTTGTSPHARRPLGGAVALGALALVVSACAPGPGAGTGGSADTGGTGASSPAASTTEGPVNAEQRASRTEVAAIAPRVVLSHEGGLLTVDAETGETVHEEDLPGFLRLNNAGDGQHVMVTKGDAFEVYNAGIDAQGHGDHFHYYTSDPGLSGIRFEAPHAGHVVVHHGLTTLFADGDGSVQTFTSEHLKEGQPRTEQAFTDAAHHGVALELTDGTLLTTQGTEESRDTVQVRDGDEVVAETSECPGVHGETAAAPDESGDVVVLGCEDGPVVYRGGAFHKVPVDGDYVRNGNLAGSEHSSIVLADMKTDAEAEQERPTEVALIDSLEDSLTTVELGSSYWFRSLARGPEGEALVLTYDGELTVIDEQTGTITGEIPVIESWEEKDEWQQPGPILKTAGSMAYVTDAEQQKLVVVDLEAGEVVQEVDLPVSPVEMAVVTGHPEAPASITAGAAASEGEQPDADQDHGGHGH